VQGREETNASDPGAALRPPLEDVFLAHLPLLENVVRFLARRHSLSAADTDDLASRVKLKVLEDDYDVLRRFQGKSSLKTYLTVVAQRVFLDARIAETGKWRPSAEARRLGPLAERLETLLSRDGLGLEEAVQIVHAGEGGAGSAEDLRALARRLPAHARRRFVGEESIGTLPASDGAADARVESRDASAAAKTARAALKRALDALAPEDRLILRLRFSDSLQIAEIAQLLRVDARPLYKRLERLLLRLRAGLEASGLEGTRVLELLGRPTTDLAAGLSKEIPEMRPSPGGDEA
jgi:RNA polymerase sigma factor (sigma-70 family)